MINDYVDRASREHVDHPKVLKQSEGLLYGYKDTRYVSPRKLTRKDTVSLVFALLFVLLVWFYLDHKLIFGEDWISATYDNEGWKTNEGDLHTYGAWDFEAHVWKTEYIMKYFPNFHWNPFWYLGMPLLEYYQSGFYLMNVLVVLLTGFSVAKAALYLVVFGHLLAVLLTFLLCYKVSCRIWLSALVSIFLLSSTFMTLRSYGWEPISVVFVFLYPLLLLAFLRAPTKPFRISVILLLTVSYLSHPLIFFSQCMFMGLYLLTISIKEKKIARNERHRHYIWAYLGAVIVALCIGAIQFVPQITYDQVTSGAHMGVSYIPFYHVPFNVITPIDFFLDAGNLKGPGFAVIVAVISLIFFTIFYKDNLKKLFSNTLVTSTLVVLASMVLFYYLERYNIFPMNFLRSIQYHRIIPEFIVTASLFVATLSNMIRDKREKIIYYTIVIAFVLSSFIVIYNVQDKWQTSAIISDKPEFLNDSNLIEGRISFPYTDQSLSVRSSFLEIPQAYGYYEQGITNAYADELFSVSSGFHSAEISLVYLEASNVGRLYINTQEGKRDLLTYQKFEGLLPFINGTRYGYFEIPLSNSGMAQAVNGDVAQRIQELAPKCRIMFKEKYCESAREEFVTKDPEEINYLKEYVSMLDEPSSARAEYKMINPHQYEIKVTDASVNDAVVVKMTYAPSFRAYVNSQRVEIERVGPDFMILRPGTNGDYIINLEYKISSKVIIGAIISVLSLIILLLYFFYFKDEFVMLTKYKQGDMYG